MSLPSPDDIVAAHKDYGLTVVEWPGWRTRGTRDSAGRPRPFDPYAQAWHHDAFREGYPDEAAAKFMAELGRPDLTPPLTNDTIGNFGTVFLLAYGNANHAGRNEADVHARLKAGLAPLGDARLDPDGDTVIGNPHLWGRECRNAGDGHDPWDQLDVMMRAGAAMADCCGWSAMASAGHRELTARKPDPVGFDMTAFRAGISRAQAEHHAQEDDDMATAPYSLWKLPGSDRVYHLAADGVSARHIDNRDALGFDQDLLRLGHFDPSIHTVKAGTREEKWLRDLLKDAGVPTS